MSDRLRNTLSLGVTLVLLTFVTMSLVTADPPTEDRAERIGSLIRCPVCNGEPIADSPAPLAEDMMGVVREGIDAGLTDEQIIDSLLASYTDSQLLDPELSVSTLALWLIPGATLVAGVVLAAGELRRRPGDLGTHATPVGAAEET